MAAAGELPAAAGARLESVRALAGLLREAQPRAMAEESTFRGLLEILTSASGEIEQACKDSHELVDLDACLLLLTECFRCLRNACVECAKNQHLLRTCLTYSDKKVVAYCCMVLFTCLDPEKVREFLDPGNLTVALRVLKVYKEQLESEWSFLIFTDRLLNSPELVQALYAKLSNQERVPLLELMMAKVSEKSPVTSEDPNVFMRHAGFLADCFQETCGAVLKLTSAAGAEDEEALVTIRLLDVLCEMTSKNRHLEHLQALPGLLETAIDTLRLTHLAGKQAVNVFTATHAVTAQEEISHPAEGFKSHLIRLIGNLCYRNKGNQDKVYELDGIPLILDNCSIDDNNPFVKQWAVFAIRNLTEQNERNQEFIAQLEHKRLADSSALESMGLEIEKRDDKLILSSARKKPS
ncbi:ataxin-10 isoform X2 [Pogoniulus pusillus]|uniref:ataxin-10 isoform X2 n=1 Tax=Pogoniulus pusillus TaxID=488313 RepID=UPI0030B96284